MNSPVEAIGSFGTVKPLKGLTVGIKGVLLNGLIIRQLCRKLEVEGKIAGMIAEGFVLQGTEQRRAD